MQASGPLAQFDQWKQDLSEIPGRIKDAAMYVPNLWGEMAGAVATMPDYPDIESDPRRKIGIGEGAGRTALERIASLGPIALENVPGPLMAYSLYKKAAGQATPVEQYEHAVNQAVGVNDQTMTFRGPGQEFLGRMGGEVAAALVPLGPLGEAGSAARISRSDARAIDAIAGLHGPEAQGVALADDILAGSASDARAAKGEAETPVAPAEAVPVPPAPAPVREAPTASGEAVAAPEGVSVEELAPDDLPPEIRARLEQQAAEPATVGEAELTPAERAAFERQTTPDVRVVPPEEQAFRDNGSGGDVGMGSIEATGRIQEERDLGRSRMLIEPNGEIRPITVDPADIHARPGQVIVQRGIGDDPEAWSVLSHGDNIMRRRAIERMEANRDRLDAAHAEFTAPEEVHNAQAVRSDPVPAGIAGEARVGGEANRSRDVQQPPPERSAAGNGEPRAAGAVREQPAQSEALTSVKNATVARERAERGLDEVNYEGGRTHGEAWQSARDRLAKEPEAGISLAHSLVERPRPTTAEETHLLTIDRARLRSEHRVAQAEVRDAMEAGDAAAEISARGRLRALEDDMEVADRASKAAGHEGAIGHAARQFAIRDDGSLAEMVTEAKVRKGEDLTPKQRSKLEEISAKYEAAEKELAELRAAATKRQTRRAPKSVQDEYESLKERLRSIPKEKHTICGAP
jgi:hypothetical protein